MDAGSLKVGSTLENLQAAFNGESNARARYLAFAKKAAQDGYNKAAALFNAAAAAEEIHAREHGKVIRSLGAEPAAAIADIEVKTTLENLKAAYEGECCERDVMYPEFIKVAEEDSNRAALRSFRWALKAEADHARMYEEAMNNLEDWKTSDTTFLVCPKCGYTTTDQDLDTCPLCGEMREEFLEIR